MKYIVYCALFGLTQSIRFRPNPAQSPWSADPSASASNKISGAYTPQDKLSSFYSRKVPDNYSGSSDDRLMNSLISNYAVEGKLQDGSGPNGQFYLTRNAATEVAQAVVQQHFGWQGEKRDNYVNSQLSKVWPHIDVLNEGFIDIAKGENLLRQVLGEVEIDNRLQLQMSDDVNESLNVQFRPDPVKSPWSATPAAGPTGKIVGAYTKNDHLTEYYDRVVPTNFASSTDDLLMRSLIINYALEGKTDGAPNQHFYLTKNGIQSVSREIVGTHFGWTGAKRDDYVQEQLTKLWPHYDVMSEGFIDVARCPPLLRTVLGEVEIDNKLQLQTDQDANLVQFRPNAVQSPWANKSGAPAGNVLTNGFPATGYYDYDRSNQIPEDFANGNDDLLMRSLIKTYSIEQRDANGQPSGNFFLDKKGMDKVASEVVGTHFQFTGDKKASFLNEKLPALWQYYDVNNQGYLVVEKAPVFLKQLIGDVEVNNQLQLQTDTDLRFRPDPNQAPWSVKEADKPKGNAITNGYQKHTNNGSIYYNRKVPGNFAAGESKSDMLMNSLISEYSIEGKDKKTKTPNGHYFINKYGAEKISIAAIEQNLEMKFKDAQKLEKERFPELWEHYDVNDDGFMEVERAPMFIRGMIGENEAAAGLQ